jgi:hypothetical protein
MDAGGLRVLDVEIDGVSEVDAALGGSPRASSAKPNIAGSGFSIPTSSESITTSTSAQSCPSREQIR